MHFRKILWIAFLIMLFGGTSQVMAAPKDKKSSSATDSPAPAQTSPADPDIAKIQKEIRDIIKLNEELKRRHKSQAAEIQRISEQAKIHQKILENMRQAPPRPPVLKPQDTEALLEQ